MCSVELSHMASKKIIIEAILQINQLFFTLKRTGIGRGNHARRYSDRTKATNSGWRHPGRRHRLTVIGHEGYRRQVEGSAITRISKAAGAQLVGTADQVWADADLFKVKNR